MEHREPQVMDGALVERRRDRRTNQPESARVWMEQADGDIEFHAVLVNMSCSGLAIRHWRKELMVGQRVRLALAAKGEIAARVMWNWAVGPVVISGLERIQSSPVIGFGPRSAMAAGLFARSSASRTWLLATLGGILVVVGWYLKNKAW
jgi:PilZ domain